MQDSADRGRLVQYTACLFVLLLQKKAQLRKQKRKKEKHLYTRKNVFIFSCEKKEYLEKDHFSPQMMTFKIALFSEQISFGGYDHEYII